MKNGEKQSDITHLYHSFHENKLSKMVNDSDQTINFKGREIMFRVAEMQNSCYMVDDCAKIQNRSDWKWIHKSETTPLTGIKLLHLVTQPFSVSGYDDLLVSRYGDLMCKIPYNVVIENIYRLGKIMVKYSTK